MTGSSGGDHGPSRRDFLRAAGAGSALLLLPGAPALAGGDRALADLLRPAPSDGAQEGVLGVGHLSPSGGPLASMGRAGARGARLGAEDATSAASLFDLEFRLVEETAGGADDAVAAFERLVDGGASAVVGGYGDETCAALMEAAARLEVPFLNVGSTADRFRGEACSRTTFHVQGSDTMYLDAAVHWLVRRSRQGIVNFGGQRQELWRWSFLYRDDERGRRLVNRASATLERMDGEPLGRFPVAPDGGDAAAALREAADADPWAVVVVADGPALGSVVEAHAAAGGEYDLVLPFGDRRRYTADGWAPEAFWPGLWHSGNFRYGATQLNDRFRERFDRPMDPQAWANWTAVKLLGDQLVAAAGEEGGGDGGLIARLEEDVRFDGYKPSPLAFRPWNHQMSQAMYVLHPSVGDTVSDPYQNIGRVPLRAADDQYITQEIVDRLGMMGRSAAESGCTT